MIALVDKVLQLSRPTNEHDNPNFQELLGNFVDSEP